MASHKGRNRQRDFDDITHNGATEFDPEEQDAQHGSEEGSDIEQSDDEFDGREHYVDVEKSKLRQPKNIPLGPQYRGLRVGRDALAKVDEDGIFSRAYDDDESDSADAEADGDGERDGDRELGSDSDEQETSAATDATDLSEEEEEEEEAEDEQERLIKDKELREELKSVKSADAQRSLAKSLSQSSREEAEKGRAIKRQRLAFDALLNTRMKLQKSLVSANTLAGTFLETINTERLEANNALEAAEAAAFRLWSSLNSVREELEAAETGKKRKRSEFAIATPTEELWNHVQAQEAKSRPTRENILKKWSARAQGPTVHTHSSRINQSEHQATIVDVLHEQLSSSDRLLKRAHAPRSCAPLQLSQRINEDEKIYDDADFYGLLLKELLEQKSEDSVAASNIDIGFQMRREAKTKRNVDTKASKGRKLRYTVHEKLQNFMAPEDRTTWGERQADGLFASLFGQGMALAERGEEDVEEVDREEAGLMMFRG